MSHSCQKLERLMRRGSLKRIGRKTDVNNRLKTYVRRGFCLYYS